MKVAFPAMNDKKNPGIPNNARRGLFVDCPSGLGGDMFLAALCDLGLELKPLQQAFCEAGVQVSVEAPLYTRRGLVGRQLAIGHSYDQPLRLLPDILRIIDALQVSEEVKTKSSAAFERLAQVEAAVHGTTVDKVHFHEVGAVDTLVDVVGAFYGLDALGIDEVLCGTLPWFRGRVHCAHGILPLPAPATLKLLEGKPVTATNIEMEIITPTGALILDQVVDAFSTGPCGTIIRSGLAWGTHDPGPESFGLRLVLFAKV
jgi:hypothetical protein